MAVRWASRRDGPSPGDGVRAPSNHFTRSSGIIFLSSVVGPREGNASGRSRRDPRFGRSAERSGFDGGGDREGGMGAEADHVCVPLRVVLRVHLPSSLPLEERRHRQRRRRPLALRSRAYGTVPAFPEKFLARLLPRLRSVDPVS